MLIAGIVLIALGVVLIFVRRSAKSKLLEIKYVKTSKARELTELAKEVGASVGQTGAFNQLIELKGIVRSENPLTSEIAKKPCVKFVSTVTREYEETYYETDPETKKRVRKTRRVPEALTDRSEEISFFVEDDTGRIKVAPSGAEIDMLEVVDRYETEETEIAQASAKAQPAIAFDKIRDKFAQDSEESVSRQIIGYLYNESILPVDTQVYVIGEASDKSGELQIQNPGESGKPFIVSTKSEEDVVKSKEGQIIALLVFAIISAVAGIGLIVASIF